MPKRFAKMKDGSVLINNSRGELVDTAAVLEAVESGKLERYITDFPSDELIGAKNVICVPHLGASTPEAEDNCAAMAAKELVDYIENGNVTHSVNFPDVQAPRAPPRAFASCMRMRKASSARSLPSSPAKASTSPTCSTNRRRTRLIC